MKVLFRFCLLVYFKILELR